ncbi:MAG: peptidase M15 [Pseudopedobacter saltans]|uniref:D-alanyl-D-alanine dipeptidase n=1 Tax=Pseudopedobacter saltans TaxID=151895 RepID=A0A2W5FBD9_9SPHI|nr:MAG: peptidase M15 [Pseudopedobacter saltans]
MKILSTLLIFSMLLSIASFAQNAPKTIDNIQTYNELPNNKKLVLLQDSIPHLKTDLVYATPHNFTKTQLYHSPKLLVTGAMATALRKASIQLEKEGYGLLVFDGYRPYAVSKKMWEIVHDDRYVANPVNGSDHNRGTAIDISLYDLKTGKPLPMPTPFDDFTEKAHLSYQPTSALILSNRNLLQNTMKSVGLKPLSTEWWHFFLPNSKEFAVLNLDFSQL